MQKIDALMKPIFDQMIANELESHRLAELRDTLLPKLMSGELKVENVTF
jgi:type I restriction enzyme S subunit